MSGHKTITHKICVIGGGPGGAAVARRLAQMRHDVCVVEGATFPRPHIGVSLPPGILPLLDGLGLRDRVENAGFLRPGRAFVSWATEEKREKIQEGPPGFQADRGVFDLLLLRGAAEAGAKIYQPAKASRPRRLPAGGWRVPVRGADGLFAIECGFLVDASGRRYLTGGRKKPMGRPTMVMFSYWRNAPMEGPEGRVEAGRSEWYWCAPLPDGTVAAAVFVDPQRLAQCKKAGAEALYLELLSRSKLLAPCLEGDRAGPVTACDATSRYVVPPVGEDFIRVGDAFLGLDPLSSQGVPAAISSALQGSVVINTILRRPEDGATARAFHQARQAEKAANNRATAAGFYAEMAAVSDDPFWQKRAELADEATTGDEPQLVIAPLSAGSVIRLSGATAVEELPAIDGDYVTSLPGLSHDSLKRPVAFLGGHPVGPLMGALGGETTVDRVIGDWARHIPQPQAFEILSWMWSNSIIERADVGREI